MTQYKCSRNFATLTQLHFTVATDFMQHLYKNNYIQDSNNENTCHDVSQQMSLQERHARMTGTYQMS